MGRASRLKRERREADKQLILKNLPPDFKNTTLRHNKFKKKISEALKELVLPFFENDMGLDAYRSLIMMGQTAWNISLTDKESFEEYAHYIEGESEDFKFQYKESIKNLIKRKKEIYPNDIRFVVGCEVSLKPNGDFYITAATARTE